MKKEKTRVFISFKNTIPNTKELTQDYTMAKELYKELNGRKIKTFFSPVTLKEMGADEWDKIINDTIHESDIMILVATNAEYIESYELKREWPVFLDLITEKKCNKRFFVYKDGNFAVPVELERKQTFMYDRTDERVREIVDHIENALAEIDVINSEKDKEKATDHGHQVHDILSPFQELMPEERQEFIDDFFSWYSKFNSYRTEEGEMPLTREVFEGFISELGNTLLYGQRLKLLKFSGQNGSGKSILLQLFDLFLKTDNRYSKKFHTLYIDLLKYYDMICRSSEKAEQDIVSEMSLELGKFINYAEAEERIPVLFVVGLNNCNYGSISIDFCLYKVLETFKKHKIRVAVAIDDYSEQAMDRILENPFERFAYKYDLRSVSLSANDRENICEAVEKYMDFLSKYHNYYFANDKADQISKFIFKNSVYTLDFFVLDLIIKKYNSFNCDILSIVESYCNDSFYGNQNKKDIFAQKAFDFIYGGSHFDDRQGVDGSHVIQVFKHNIIVQYLISCYYLKRFEEFDISRGDISFFEQILPKEITRFLMPMINQSNSVEEKIIQFCELRHKDMTHLCQSEMHYFLGRIKNQRFKERSEELLKKLYAEFKNEFLEAQSEHISTDILKQKAFLYRSLAVSLIYKKDHEVAREYLLLLISDEISNMINRGFHLEYYGDKPFMPRLNYLDVADVVSVGEKTVVALLQSLEGLSSSTQYLPVIDLSMFTLYSILQVRMESTGFKKEKMTSYINKCLDIFPIYTSISSIAKDEKIGAYYEMVNSDFKKYLENGEKASKGAPMLNILYESLSSLEELDRSGWKKYFVPTPESVTEHMYNCWLLALLYLPDNYDAEGYNKESILKMLLIHDWAESITGDINKPEKKEADYQHEKKLMRMILLKGTYPSIADLNGYYDVWDEFEANFKRSENAKIAKDIDCVQALHQFCCYNLKYPDNFPEWVREEWFDLYYNELKSNLGKELFRKIILDNKRFEGVIPPLYR